LNDGLIERTEETITEEGISSSSAKIFPAGTLLIALYGATVGKLGVLQMDAATNQAVCAIFPSVSVLRDYLFYVLLLERHRLVEISFGGAQPNISQEIIRDIAIPLPPLSEQKRIVAAITEQIATIGKAQIAVNSQIEAASALVASTLRQTFAGHDARKWLQSRLGEVLLLRKEVVHPRDNPTGAATFVGLEHIESGSGHRIGEIDIEMSALTGRKPRFYKGDIVYGYLRPYLNKVWVAEFDGLCSVDQYVYSTSGRADAEFIAWFMRSPVFLERAPISTTPGQLPRIRTEEVAGVHINLPPIKEQRRISGVLAERMAQVQRLKFGLKLQAEAISNLTSAQLRRAFAGEING